MKRYSVGFIFSPDFKQVLLLQKTHPQWMAGKWNGIGGHVEEGESPIEAMWRECMEECGLDIRTWNLFTYLGDDSHYALACFWAVSDELKNAESRTEEPVAVFDLNLLPSQFSLLGSVSWLIPMALAMAQGHDKAKQYTITHAPVLTQNAGD